MQGEMGLLPISNLYSFTFTFTFTNTRTTTHTNTNRGRGQNTEIKRKRLENMSGYSGLGVPLVECPHYQTDTTSIQLPAGIMGKCRPTLVLRSSPAGKGRKEL